MAQAPLSFTDLLAAAAACARRMEEEGVLSLAVPLQGHLRDLDPLELLPHLEDHGEGDGFRFLWDGAPGLCVAASGRCHGMELSGPRRFELAQRFAMASLNRLAMATTDVPPLARPRLLLAFSFFDTPLHPAPGASGVQAVLPRWQLSRQGRHCWLRLQRGVGGAVTARSVAEELWQMARHLEGLAGSRSERNEHQTSRSNQAHGGRVVGITHGSNWHGGYRAAVARALELVEEGELQKLVLAVRQRLFLDAPLDPLILLGHLRSSQPGSCRFLWQNTGREALLGASPERLLTLRQGQLRCDALAGTAALNGSSGDLLRSGKDRHEHDLVVRTIISVLERCGLTPRRPRHPRLARHGGLVHLHTPITAKLGGQLPLNLAEALHPTPAVAGLPRREAMAWLRALEPFERGNYAAPIGWIDSEGDADLRVAIRSGVLRERQLEITAGAGLVRGSQPERELQEVALKLGVLQQQLNLPGRSGLQVASNRSMV